MLSLHKQRLYCKNIWIDIIDKLTPFQTVSITWVCKWCQFAHKKCAKYTGITWTHMMAVNCLFLFQSSSSHVLLLFLKSWETDVVLCGYGIRVPSLIDGIQSCCEVNRVIKLYSCSRVLHGSCKIIRVRLVLGLVGVIHMWLYIVMPLYLLRQTYSCYSQSPWYNYYNTLLSFQWNIFSSNISCTWTYCSSAFEL